VFNAVKATPQPLWLRTGPISEVPSCAFLIGLRPLEAERPMRRAWVEYGPAGVDLASDRAK
jgi:hypothetical protein